jgi:uncharacterized protein (DUF302 family)
MLLTVSITLLKSWHFESTSKKENSKMETTKYAFKTTVNLSYEEAIQKVTEELKKEGFGVLTEIDVKETLKKKLDVDFRQYKILGACNPPNAYKALQAETDIGLMLPCNVIIYESSESGETVVAAINPVAAMSLVGNVALEATALEVKRKLRNVIESMEV